jgi:hypothetical protein
MQYLFAIRETELPPIPEFIRLRLSADLASPTEARYAKAD